MVNLISLARQFEMQVKLLQTADLNAQRADQLLSMNG
jgi:flagellar basal-body rod protein FlgF